MESIGGSVIHFIVPASLQGIEQVEMQCASIIASGLKVEKRCPGL